MNRGTSAFLVGFLNNVGRRPSFVMPAFKENKTDNTLLAQVTSIDGRVESFSGIDPGNNRLIEATQDAKISIGDSAFWAFEFSDKTIMADEHQKLAERLTPRVEEHIAWPSVYLQLVRYCGIREKLPDAARRAYRRIAESSQRSADAWRNLVFLPSLVREAALECTPEPSRTPAILRLVEEISVSVASQQMSVAIPQGIRSNIRPSFEEFRGRVDSISMIFGIATTDIRTEERLPLQGRQIQQLPNLAVVIGVGKGGCFEVEKFEKKHAKAAQTKGSKPRTRYQRALPSKNPLTEILKIPSAIGLNAAALALPQIPEAPSPLKPTTPDARPQSLVFIVFAQLPRDTNADLDLATQIARRYTEANHHVVAVLVPEIGSSIGARSWLRNKNSAPVFSQFGVPIVLPGRTSATRRRDRTTSKEANAAISHLASAIDGFSSHFSDEQRWIRLTSSTKKSRVLVALTASCEDDSLISDATDEISARMIDNGIFSTEADAVYAFVESTLTKRFSARRARERLTDIFPQAQISFASSLLAKPTAELQLTCLAECSDFTTDPSAQFEKVCAGILLRRGYTVSYPSDQGLADLLVRIPERKAHVPIACLWTSGPIPKWRVLDLTSRIGEANSMLVCMTNNSNRAIEIEAALGGLFIIDFRDQAAFSEVMRNEYMYLINLLRDAKAEPLSKLMHDKFARIVEDSLMQDPDRYSLTDTLNELSPRTRIDGVQMDEAVERMAVDATSLTFHGSMNVDLELDYGSDDDNPSSQGYPGSFVIRLDQDGFRLIKATIDNSEFFE